MLTWKLIKSQNIKERQMTAHIYVHQKTKAELIYLANEDINKAFSVTFKTIPQDSTGAAHILEHTVLTGSRKYPVRDLFFSMLKRSLQSFMNAFTSEDWTAYPFASPNEQDFFNLLDIYLDAAFFPLLKEENFRQEGHRLEFGGNELVRKGVVYNEMKGAMSSPERVMVEGIKSRLFPTTTYRFNAGGDPAAIPELSHAGLKEFHQRFYHPSNAAFFVYGRLDIDRVLAQIESQVLANFSFQDPDAEVPLEPRWPETRPERIVYPYTGVEAKRKHQYACTWLLNGIENNQEALAWEILDDLLLGHPGAPLRANLLASGLGSDLSDGAGLNSECRQLWFSAGLKDTAAGAGEKIKDIILKTLVEAGQKGFSQREVEAAIRKKEFSVRERTNSPYPYGLQLWIELIGPYLHGGEPVELLSFKHAFQKLRHDIKQDLLIELIKDNLIANTHRLDLEMAPDPDLAARRQEEEKKELSRIKAGLSPAQKEGILKQAQDLERLQSQKEDLSCLPKLDIKDIDPKVRQVKIEIDKNIVRIRQNTNGLFYSGHSFDVAGLSHEDRTLLPLLAFLLTRVGTKKMDHQELARRIQDSSGGMSAAVFAKTDLKTGQALGRLTLNAKCLPANIANMLELVAEIVGDSSFKDQDLIKRFLSEYIARFEQNLTDQGHFYAMSLAARGLSESCFLNEESMGVGQLRHLRSFKEKKDLDRRLTDQFSSLQRQNPLLALIASAAELKKAEAVIKKQDLDKVANTPVQYGSAGNTALITDTDVSFCAEAVSCVTIKDPDAPALFVFSKLLSRGFLHKQIREIGGAYGGLARYDLEDGIWYFASYRDPHLARTFQVFEQAKSLSLKSEFSSEEVKNTIIMCSGELDRPDAPVEAARKAFARHLIGLDDKTRQAFKNGLLAVEAKDLKRVAEKYLLANTDRHLAVISNQAKINEELGEVGEFKIIKL